VIGVPGMKAGNAWYDSAAQRGTQQGALIGYLTPGVTVGGGAIPNPYSFVFGADQYVLVDSCATDPVTKAACAIEVGDQFYDPGANGMNVVALDRVTFYPWLHTTVTNTHDLWQALASVFPIRGHYQQVGSVTSQGGTTLYWNTDQVVVVIQSVGTGALGYADDPTLQLIDQLGGTPETFAAAITQGKPYALVGVASDLPWHGRGFESSPVINPAMLNPPPETGFIRGVLARDRTARYTPQAGDPIGSANFDLATIIYQPTTAWPYATDCAIAYIAGEIGLGAYPDIRSAYYEDTNAEWDDKRTDLASVPATPNATCATDLATFGEIQAQLSSEFEYVAEVQNFISNLMQPFVETQGAVDVQTIAQQIASTVNPPTSSETNLGWLDIIAGVTGLVGSTPGLPGAEAFGILSSSAYLAVDLMENINTASSGPGASAANIQVEAGQLTQQLTVQEEGHLAALGDLYNILVADWGKLETVGFDAGGGDSAWAWNTTTTSNAVTALNQTTVQAVYSALLPATWQLYNLKPSYPDSQGGANETSSANVATFACGYMPSAGEYALGYPFKDALAANQLPSTVQMVGTTIETTTNEVWTFGFVAGSSFSHYPYSNGGAVTLPTTNGTGVSLTTDIFGTGDDPSTGLVQGAAYPPAWYRKTYNPPALVICNDDTYSGVARAPPVIGPAAAAETGG
jgi:hypothetical protein